MSRYFLIPTGALGGLKSHLIELVPASSFIGGLGQNGEGITYSMDGDFALFSVPEGNYPAWAEDAVFAYEVSYEFVLELLETPAWKVEGPVL